MKTILYLLLISPTLLAGSFSGAAGTSGSDAISKDSTAFVAWASGNLTPAYGSDVDSVWRTPAKAYGPATTSAADIVCLGNGGEIIMTFPRPIRDGIGPDFAVFENSFSHTFLELAFVEVSSDGINFFRFSNRSEGVNLIGGFGNVDPTTLNGLAGKYKSGFGTGFDLALLPTSPLLDLSQVRFVKLVDIIGNGSILDSSGAPIYDPTPTIGSGGFDLDAIGVIHQNENQFRVLNTELIDRILYLTWESNPGSLYQIETSTDLLDWAPIGTFPGVLDRGATTQLLNRSSATQRFWRVVWLAP